MRANATVSSATAVAVVAEQPIGILRPALALKVQHKHRASGAAAIGVESPPVRRAVIIDMIKREETRVCFAAAIAPPAVGSDHFSAKALGAFLDSLAGSLAVVRVPVTSPSARSLKVSRGLALFPKSLLFIHSRALQAVAQVTGCVPAWFADALQSISCALVPRKVLGGCRQLFVASSTFFDLHALTLLIGRILVQSRREHCTAETARRAELFSRQSRVGFDTWGNETGKFDGEAA